MTDLEGEGGTPITDAIPSTDPDIALNETIDGAEVDEKTDLEEKTVVDDGDLIQDEGDPDPDQISISGEITDHEPDLDHDDPDEQPPTISSDIMSPPGVPALGGETEVQAPSPEPVPATTVPVPEPPLVFNDKDNPCPEPIWNKAPPRHQIDRLDQLCCQLIAANLTQSSLIDEIPSEYLPAIISRLDPTQIDILEAARNIHCDQFWKFLSMQWPLADVRQHGRRYKRLFFEKFLQERLESYHDHNRSDLNRYDLMAEMEVARPYVHTITFREQRSHLNLSTLLKGFFNLTRLDMRYGAYNLAMMYDADEFGMKGNDILGLNKVLTETRSLTTLLIRESLLNDELVGVLSRGLITNQTLTHLDLSHNRIGDEGGQRLAQVLAQDGTVLTCLNLADNNLGAGAAAAFAQALQTNTCLQQLCLRLNQIGTDGAVSLFARLNENTTLIALNLSCNGVQDVDQELIEMLHRNRTLQCLDLSGNQAVRVEFGASLVDAVKSISQLWELDLRLNPGLSEQVDNEIRALLVSRQERLDRARRINYLTDRALI